MHQVVEQRPVAAADVQHPRARLHHVGNQLQVDADARPARRNVVDGHGYAIPRCSAQPVRKPPSTANSSGSSSRKASCPLSLSISTKLTFAATAFNAWTTARLSEVGNSQSLVKEIRQKRVRVS